MALAQYLYPLRDEITNDPLGRGYSTMTDQEVADDLNTAYRERAVNSISGDLAFRQTTSTDFANLSDVQKQMWISWSSKDSIDPWAQTNVDFVTWLFGSGAATLNNLANVRTEWITRASELGYGTISTAWVTRCREEI